MRPTNTNLRHERANIMECALLFATGFVALSNFADVVIGMIGYNIIEILFIPILLYYYKGKIVVPGTISYRLGETLLIFWLMASVCIAIVSTNNVFAVVTCIRPFVYILLILKYFNVCKKQMQVEALFLLALGCVCGDLVYILNYSTLFASQGYSHINIIAVALVTMIPIILHKGLLAVFGFLLSVVAAMLSGYRINTAVILVALVSGVLVNLVAIKQTKTKFVYMLLLVVLIAGVNWCINNFEMIAAFLTDALNLGESTVTRSLDRIAGMLKGDYTLGDKNRMEKLTAPFRDFLKYLFPKGPIGKADLWHFGYYTDVPMIFLYDLFGSVGAWIFLVIYACQLCLKAYKILSNWESASGSNRLFVVMIPVIVCLFILNGTFLTFVNISILFALAISGSELVLQDNASGKDNERCI